MKNLNTFIGLWLISTLMLLIAPTNTSAREYAVYTYSSNDFPDLGIIRTIMQDSRGMFWFGGDRGAAYYDGRLFHRFSTQNGLPDNYVYTIKESPEKEIWICTYRGINIYNPQKNELRLSPVLPGTAIRDIEFIPAGVLITTNGHAHLYRDQGGYEFWQFRESYLRREISPVNAVHYEKETNSVWIATSKAGVLKIDLGEYQKLWEFKDDSIRKKYESLGKDEFLKLNQQLFSAPDSLSNMELSFSLFKADNAEDRSEIISRNTQIFNLNSAVDKWYISSIQQAPSGDIYAFGRKEVFKLVNGEFTLVSGFNDLAGDLSWFKIESNGDFVFAGENGAFVVSANDTLQFSKQSGLPENIVTSFYRDAQHILWMTTSGGNLHKIVDPGIRIFDSETYPHLNGISSALKLPDSSILIGSESGISKYNHNNVAPFFFQPPSDEAVLGFAFDRNQDVIAATTSRLYLFKDGTVSQLAGEIESIYHEVQFQIDSNNILWIIMGMKVFSWDGQKLKSEKILEEYVYLPTFTSLGDDGSLFFGTWRGLFRLDYPQLWYYTYSNISVIDLRYPEKGFRELMYRPEHFIVDDVMMCGAFGGDSTYWFGTFGGGLVKFRNDSMQSFGHEEKVVSRQFNNAYQDDKGDLYFLGDEGVALIKDGEINNLQFDINPEFNDMQTESDGKKIFATSMGLIVQDESIQVLVDRHLGLKTDRITKIIHVEKDKYLLLQKNGMVTINLDHLFSIDSLHCPLAISGITTESNLIDFYKNSAFKTDKRNLRFRFNLNDYISEYDNKYSWYIEGLEKDYNNFSFHQIAFYPRLPAGKYIFHLKSLNSRGQLFQLQNAVKFEIEPYFHETLFFKGILGIASILFIFVFALWRIRRIERANIVLEEKVKARTQELEDALNNIKTLKGLIPICANCKKIRDDTGYWQQVESYVALHSEASFTHGICPDCRKELYPGL